MDPRAIFRRWLALPAVYVWLPLAGTLFASSAVGRYLVFDDFILALAARGESSLRGFRPAGFDLFTFTTGAPGDNHALMDQGLMLPWWSDPELKIVFFRPLSSLSHRLDYVLWPASPQLMYWHSLAWLALLLFVVARCYRLFETSPLVAGLATLLFAVDDTHAGVVAWLSNRNALIATTFGVLALSAHHRARSEGHRWCALAAPLCFALALAAGEFGVAALAYLFAYTLFLDAAPVAQRWRALAPYGAVLAAWFVVYLESGAGVHGSGTYVSPLSDPARFLLGLPERAGCLWASAVGPLSSDLLLLGSPTEKKAWMFVAALTLGVAGYAAAPFIRRDALARFWLAGAGGSLLPVAASFPSDRLLLFASVGAMALVSRVIVPLFERREHNAARAAVALGFAIFHIGCAPALLSLRATQMQVIGRALSRATGGWPARAAVRDRTLVILNAPTDIFASYLQAELALQHRSRPRHLYWLTSASSEIRVTRTSATSLSLEREGGFLSTPLEGHFRSAVGDFAPGTRVQLTEMSAMVERATTDGRPLSVKFEFRESLESDAYLFLVWRGDRYQRLQLPRLNRTMILPREDVGGILRRSALGAS